MAKKKPKVDWKVVCVALMCITLLECYALSLGYNGWRLTAVIAIIAACAGYVIPPSIKLK